MTAAPLQAPLPHQGNYQGAKNPPAPFPQGYFGPGLLSQSTLLDIPGSSRAEVGWREGGSVLLARAVAGRVG